MPRSRKREKKKQRSKGVVTDVGRFIFYMTYAPSCVALYKLTAEMQAMYNELKMGFMFIPQHPPYGPYKLQPKDVMTYPIDQMPFLVLHRVGSHNFDPRWATMISQIMRARKMNGLKTHYFLDDFLLYMNDWLPPKLMQTSDIIVTLGYLLKPYLEEQYGFRNIIQLKTHVDVDLYDSITAREGFVDKSKVNVMWFSMVRTGLGFMKMLFAKIDKLNDFKDFVFHCVAPQSALMRAELYTYRNVTAKYYDFLQPQALIALEKASKVILNPIHTLTDNHEFVPDLDRRMFMDAKSEVKYTHAGAANRPLLTCKSLPYETVIRNEENGIITDDIDEWVEYLLKLKDDEDFYNSIVKVARGEIEEYYAMPKRFDDIRKIFTS